jgi:hypothetical protein
LLNNNYFYFSTIRKYVALFGAIFNDMTIQRTDSNNNITQVVNIPLSYAQKEKMMVRMKADPSIEKQAAIILPRMSFFLDGYAYDTDRKLPTSNKLVFPGATPSSALYQFTEVPWNFDFSLYVYVKNTEDGTKIIEQIIPFFTPAFTVKAKLIPQQQSRDISINLRSVSHADTDSTDFKDNSLLIWTLQFTVKGFLFGPIHSAPFITFANTAFYYGSPAVAANTPNTYAFGLSNNIYQPVQSSNATLGDYVVIQPGLDANGNPTTLLANSIPTANINYDDPWGIIELLDGVQISSNNGPNT